MTHTGKNGKTKGCEVWLYENNDKTLRPAYKILQNMSKLGFTNRGVKLSKDLYFLKHTTKPAMLIEVCFVDDKDDATLYVRNREKIAKIIANAFVE